jgi:hypothetical protein
MISTVEATKISGKLPMSNKIKNLKKYLIDDVFFSSCNSTNG